MSKTPADKPKYICGHCGGATMDEESMVTHYKLQHPDKVFGTAPIPPTKDAEDEASA